MKKYYEILLTNGSKIKVEGWCAPAAIERSGYARYMIEHCIPI